MWLEWPWRDQTYVSLKLQPTALHQLFNGVGWQMPDYQAERLKTMQEGCWWGNHKLSCEWGWGNHAEYWTKRKWDARWQACKELEVYTGPWWGQFWVQLQALWWESPQREQECVPCLSDGLMMQECLTLKYRQRCLPSKVSRWLSFQTMSRGHSGQLDCVVVCMDDLCPLRTQWTQRMGESFVSLKELWDV